MKLHLITAFLAACALGVVLPAAGSGAPARHCTRPGPDFTPFKRSPVAIVYRLTVKEPSEERFKIYAGCVRRVGRTKDFWNESEELAVAKNMELHGAQVTFVTSDCTRSRYTTHRVDLRTGKRRIVRVRKRPCP